MSESRITDVQIMGAISFTRTVASVLHTYAGIWKYLCAWLISLNSWFVTPACYHTYAAVRFSAYTGANELTFLQSGRAL